MQKITVAKVETKPTVKGGLLVTLCDEKNTRFSGFLDELHRIKEGDIVEIEVQVNGRFNNITAAKIINHSETTQELKTPPLVVNLAEIESKYRIAALEAAICIKDVGRDEILPWADKFYGWLKGEGVKSAQVAKPPEQKTMPLKAGNGLSTLEFLNPGEFYTACLGRFKLSKSTIDKEISGFDLNDPEQRKKAWHQVIAIYGHEVK